MHLSTAGASSVKKIIERRCDSVLDFRKRVILVILMSVGVIGVEAL